MASNLDYSDPHVNYKRLLDTIQFLENCRDIHPNFYDIHIEHIHMYSQVLLETPEVNQEAQFYLQLCINQYLQYQQFDLPNYLEACKQLLANISEFEMQKMMNNLSLTF